MLLSESLHPHHAIFSKAGSEFLILQCRPTSKIMYTPCRKKRKKDTWNALQLCFSRLYLYSVGKQQRSYFRNEAIKQIQNEHNPLVNQHMAMSFACLWITNLWGEFLQMEFSMPCALCFKHSKQTNKSVLGPELLQLALPPPKPTTNPPSPQLSCQVTHGWLTLRPSSKSQQEKE